MSKSTRNYSFLHVSNHLILLPITHFACLTVHKRSPQLVTATFTYFCIERHLMKFIRTVQTLHNHVKILSIVMVAQLSILYILFNLFRANNASILKSERILYDVGTLIAYLTVLTDLMNSVRLFLTRQFDLVC